MREGAGLIDRPRGTIAVTGQDRASFLQGLLTNDVVALQPGRGCYAAYLTAHGRMVADMRVLEMGDVMLLDVHPSRTAMLVANLENLLFSEDVQVADWSDKWVPLGVHGPRSAAALVSVFATNPSGDEPPLTADRLAAMAEYESRSPAFGGTAAIVVRSDDYAAMGFDVYVPPRLAQQFRSALAATGVGEVGSDTVDALRIEAGRPAFLIDMDEETIPLEAGLEDRAISFSKGCYVGQELIIRIMHRGHGRVAKRLVGLAIDTGAVAASAVAAIAAPGDAVLHDGQDVGRLTSVAFSPRLGYGIALGYVQRSLAEPGTQVMIEHAGQESAAVVTALPFVGA